jgi:predicted nuclease of predicted toxin-antitoxin system
MRLLADEHIPLPSIRLLREAGHAVEAVAEVQSGISDPNVLAQARDSERLLLTFDSDFGKLLFVEQQPPPLGVVYFRFAQRTPTEAAEMLLRLVRAEAPLERRFTTVRRDRVRQRPLPPMAE